MSIIERTIKKIQQSGVEIETTTPTRGDSGRLRDSGAQAGERARATRTPAKSIEIKPGELISAGLVPGAQDEDRSREEFRRIKRPLLQSAMDASGVEGDTPSNCILVASAVSGEGKTYVAFNLSLSIARERDHSVLLIDGDVAKQHLTRVLCHGEAPGLTDAVANPSADIEDFLVGTNIPGLVFLPAGTATGAIPELFASGRMASVVARLAQGDRQRVVLFDSSPLLVTSEAPLLARLVNQIVLIVRAESTQQHAVNEAVGLLDKTKSIRTVLNQSRPNVISDHYYGYGYYRRRSEGS